MPFRTYTDTYTVAQKDRITSSINNNLRTYALHLKSSGDFSSCGFDSHPGHHVLKYLRIEQPRESLISRQITLTLPRRSAQSQMSANPGGLNRLMQHHLI